MRGLTPPRQKCDAKQPCTTCVNGGRGTGCTYELQRRSRPTSANVFFVLQDRTPAPPNVHNLHSRAPANVPSKAPINPPRDLPLIIWPDSNECIPSFSPPPAPRERSPTPTALPSWDFSPRMHDTALPGFPSDILVVQGARGTAKCIQRPVVSSFTVLPSIHFQTIPRSLRSPFSLIPPERVQVSGVAGSDLGMTLYVSFPVS